LPKLSRSSIVYIGLTETAALLLSAPNPKVKVRFPTRTKETSTKMSQQTTSDNGWINTNKAGFSKKRKIATPKSKKSANSSTSYKKKNKSRKMTTSETISSELSSRLDGQVIDIIDDSDDDAIISRLSRRKSKTYKSLNHANVAKTKGNFGDLESSSENEF